MGAMVLDRFALPVGPRELRRVPISAAQFGTADTVEMVLAVDQTFIPSSVPELRSTDHRELGVRVFRAFIQPR
jgi:hypothetical protein